MDVESREIVSQESQSVSLTPSEDTFPHLSKNPKDWFLATVQGTVAYICPECGHINQIRNLNIRHPKHRCNGCRVGFAIGVMAWRGQLPKIAPRNGKLAKKVLGQQTANCLDESPGVDIESAVYGIVQWRCPECGRLQRTAKSFGHVTCECGQSLGVALHLWYQLNGQHARVPSDWVLQQSYQERAFHGFSESKKYYRPKVGRAVGRRGQRADSGVAADVGVDASADGFDKSGGA